MPKHNLPSHKATVEDSKVTQLMHIEVMQLTRIYATDPYYTFTFNHLNNVELRELEVINVTK